MSIEDSPETTCIVCLRDPALDPVFFIARNDKDEEIKCVMCKYCATPHTRKLWYDRMYNSLENLGKMRQKRDK